ncbi:MAG: T9SS type A sorting domain-containing protein [Saprospiraceae bacterium]|nr:T9SS type A sorting domain-containing protein [Candidatus Defluviibacterium haderslevense]
MSKYSRSSPGGIYHEDAILIKTEPVVVSTKDLQLNLVKYQFNLLCNLVKDNIDIEGPIDIIKNWSIYSLSGDILLNDYKWSNPVNISGLDEGMYVIKIMDRNNFEYLFKFVKI